MVDLPWGGAGAQSESERSSSLPSESAGAASFDNLSLCPSLHGCCLVLFPGSTVVSKSAESGPPSSPAFIPHTATCVLAAARLLIPVGIKMPAELPRVWGRCCWGGCKCWEPDGTPADAAVARGKGCTAVMFKPISCLDNSCSDWFTSCNHSRVCSRKFNYQLQHSTGVHHALLQTS